MKKIRSIVLCVAALLLIVACTGCSSFMEAFEDEKTRGYTELVLDSVVANDLDAAYGVFSDICDKDSFAPTFYDIKNMMKDVESYELKLLSINTNTSLANGGKVTEVSSVYELSSDGGKFIVDVKTNSMCLKLSSFYVAPYEETNYYYTGTLGSMKDANALQWIVLLSNLVILGAMVFAVVDCCRHKVRLKPLWIIIVIIAMFSVGFTLSEGNLNFNLSLGWLTAYNALILYGGGATSFRVMVPVGVVAYFIVRHWIIKKSEEPVLEAIDSEFQPELFPRDIPEEAEPEEAAGDGPAEDEQ